jgi:hypothetical protein
VVRTSAGSARRSQRRRALIGVLVGVLALLPAAIAWACNPQAHISLDRTSYSPGQTITVYGSYFPADTAVQVSGPVNSTTATTDGGGSFAATLTAPSQAGDYTISAKRATGGFAPASFTVAAPAQTNNPPAGNPQPNQEPAPAQSQQPDRAAPTAPAVTRSERVQQAPRRDAPAREPSTTTTTTGTTTTPVFTGSTAPAPAAAGTFATTPTTTAAPATRRENARGSERQSAATPSQQTAFSDVWGAFEPGRTATLAAASGAPDGGAGSQLGWGLGLLALGLFSLVGGLAYTEARRRRTA